MSQTAAECRVVFYQLGVSFLGTHYDDADMEEMVGKRNQCSMTDDGGRTRILFYYFKTKEGARRMGERLKKKNRKQKIPYPRLRVWFYEDQTDANYASRLTDSRDF
jgi:hypothetical protein